MAKIENIKAEFDLPRYKINFYLENFEMAKWYSISCLGSVREQWRPLDLYFKGNILTLDGPISDSNGTIIPIQKEKVDEVAMMLKNTIENDVPGFKEKIEQVIQFNQENEKLDFWMASILDTGLKEKTKRKFMAIGNDQILARIIRMVFETGPCASCDEFDKKVNSVFDNQMLIM